MSNGLRCAATRRSRIIQHGAGTLGPFQNIGCFGYPDERLRVVVVFADVVAEGHDHFLNIAEDAAAEPLLGEIAEETYSGPQNLDQATS